eukprot:Rmarinus@m.10820
MLMVMMDTRAVQVPTAVFVDPEDHRGRTPLYLAAAKGFSAIIDVLLRAGADHRHPCTEHSRTPLFLAAQWGHIETVRVLISTSEPAVDVPDCEGRLPKDVAADEEIRALLSQ